MSEQAKGVACGLLAATFMAAYLSTNRYVYANHDVDAFSYTVTFSAAGGLFALLALAARYFKKRGVKVPFGTVPLLFVVGLTGAVSMALLVFGQNFTTAVNAGIIMTGSIVTTALFSKMLLGERFSHRQLRWLIVMFVGMYLGIVGLHIIKFNLGDLIILGAVVAFGFNNTFSKVVIRRFDGNFVADARLAISGLLMIVLGAVALGGDTVVLSAGLWPLLAGLFFWLTIRTFYSAVHHISSNKATVLINGQIFFTALAGVFLLSEAYDWVKFAGSAVVLLSVYFISKK